MFLASSITRVYIRILLFYIGGVTIIGLLVPANNPDLNLKDSTAAKSPFVIAIKTAGIKGLPSVINAALLTSAWSAASSDLYTSSRALCKPAIFCYIFYLAHVIFRRSGDPRQCSQDFHQGSKERPSVGVRPRQLQLFLPRVHGYQERPWKSFWLVSSLIFTLNTPANRSCRFANMTSIAGLMSWFGIFVTYLRFYKGLKVQGIDRATLPYTARFQPYAAWYGTIACIVICFVSST